MRKPERAVQLDDIISSQIIGEDGELVALTIKIHLALEAIIIDMIKISREDNKIYSMRFPEKLKYLIQEGVISDHDRIAFDRFNNFRNDVAHIFSHQITMKNLLRLARELEDDGIDFSDSVGRYTEAQATEYYDGSIGVLAEIGWCILFHASHLLMQAGGRDIFDNGSTE